MSGMETPYVFAYRERAVDMEEFSFEGLTAVGAAIGAIISVIVSFVTGIRLAVFMKDERTKLKAEAHKQDADAASIYEQTAQMAAVRALGLAERVEELEKNNKEGNRLLENALAKIEESSQQVEHLFAEIAIRDEMIERLRAWAETLVQKLIELGCPSENIPPFEGGGLLENFEFRRASTPKPPRRRKSRSSST